MSKLPIHLLARCLILLLMGSFFSTKAQVSQAFTARDLIQLNRVSDPHISPDGKNLAFTMRETDLEANRGRTDIWILNLDSAQDVPRRLAAHPTDDSAPRWAPDSSGIFFLSTRSGSSQVWFLPINSPDAQPVTALPLDVGSYKLSPKGDRIVVSLEVFPECATLDCTAEKLSKNTRSKETGQVYDHLFVCHLDTWNDGQLAQLFSAPLDAEKRAGAMTPLSGKIRANVPSKPFGGDEEFAFSPDGSRLVFAARLTNHEEPWSTNFDLYEIASDGSGEIRDMTGDNPAWDTQPVFLANGDMAWLAMSRPGYEADKFTLMLRAAADGRVRRITDDWDRSILKISASADGLRLLASTNDAGQT